MRLILIGFGVVGQGLARILRDQAGHLRNSEGFTAQIVGVATRSRGTLYHPDGLELEALLQAIEQGHLKHYPERAGLVRDQSVLDLIRDGAADVVVEASITNLDDGQPALDYCRAALDSGKHVVLANKGPIAIAYADLAVQAERIGKQVLFEATVMAGTPALRLAQTALGGCQIQAAQGILNGTTNYILTQMEAGMDYADALQQAQALGYAEADPTADVEGWDAASKVVILGAALFGQHWSLSTLSVTGISQLTAADIDAARAAGERWKLIASATPTGGKVEPVRLPVADPLANVTGATNAITYTTDLMGPVTLVGAGAGQIETGFGLLADLLAIDRIS